MRFAIIDIDGTTLDTFDDQRAAVAAALVMIEREPASTHEIFLLAYTDDGEPFGEAVPGNDLLARKVRWQTPGSGTARPRR